MVQQLYRIYWKDKDGRTGQNRGVFAKDWAEQWAKELNNSPANEILQKTYWIELAEKTEPAAK